MFCTFAPARQVQPILLTRGAGVLPEWMAWQKIKILILKILINALLQIILVQPCCFASATGQLWQCKIAVS